jgi:hypothetical protein
MTKQDRESPSPQKGFDRGGRGIVLVATGETYRAEARLLITSLLERSPQIPITVFVDQLFGVSRPGQVTEIILDSATFSFKDKAIALQRRPYSKTLYIDVDCYAASDVEESFSLLDGCEVAAVHDTWRIAHQNDPPQVFPELNAGVILLGGSPAVDTFLSRWISEYERTIKKWRGPERFSDQPSFCSQLWEMQKAGDLRFLALPVEWNIHAWHPVSLAQNASPRILHGRKMPLARIAESLRASSEARVWLPGPATPDESALSRVVSVQPLEVGIPRKCWRRFKNLARRLLFVRSSKPE